jgi:putative addiction module component (TIGR02574 family)
MLKTTDLIKEALSLPVEQRVELADSLLKSLNAPDEKMDRIWAEEAKRRLDELRSGKVKAVSGAEVFERIRTRFAR